MIKFLVGLAIGLCIGAIIGFIIFAFASSSKE